MRLKDKVVIVTGSARGIGQAIARRCANEGACVVVADVRDEAGRETVLQIEQAGGRGKFVHCDVSLKSQVEALVQKTMETWGRIEILVNDAGVCPFWDFTTMPEEIWDKALDTNLKGAFLCSQAVSKAMIEKGNGGRIINIGSISSIVGGARQAHYCASKAGINLLTASMAIALGPHGITCNAILPGPIETDLNRDDLARPEKREYFIGRTPLGRIGQPEDIAGPVIFFATDDSAWCTGATLVVDGGILVNFQ
jgi:L-rhamnose 1-dehydrogenase